MNFDWAEWGPPLAVLAFGLFAGVVAAVRLKMQEDTSVTAQGREQDLIQAHEAAVESLRSLELDQGKLDPADYQRERQALLTRGAAALRELEAYRAGEVAEPAPAAAAPAEGSAQEPAAAPTRAPAAPVPEERPLISPEWKGALTALTVMALVAFLWQVAGGESVPRREGASMTGNQDLGVAEVEPGTRAPWQNAKAALEAQLEQNPQDLAVLNELTQLTLSVGDPHGAMQYNQRVLELDPKNIDGRVYKAVLAAFIGMTDRALEALEEVLGEAPDHGIAWTYKGLIQLEEGKADAAVTSLEKAVALQPGAQPIREALDQARAIASGQAPAPSAAAQAAPAAPSGAVVVQGTARLAPEKAASLTGREVLYVSLRSPQGGPPLAAVRLPAGPFPASFTVTTADAIAMGGAPRPFPEQMNLVVRIDRDGDPMTREPDEPMAEIKAVSKGSTDLDLLLQ